MLQHRYARAGSSAKSFDQQFGAEIRPDCLDFPGIHL
jgi:hypothetical protein